MVTCVCDFEPYYEFSSVAAAALRSPAPLFLLARGHASTLSGCRISGEFAPFHLQQKTRARLPPSRFEFTGDTDGCRRWRNLGRPGPGRTEGQILVLDQRRAFVSDPGHVA